MECRSQFKGRLFIVLSAVIYGCMPLGAAVLYAEGVTPASLVLLRNCLSLPLLALLAHRSGGLHISRGALREVALASVVGASLTPVLLFTSYRYLASGTAAVFHYSYPVAVVLGGFLLREKIRRSAVLCTLLCTAGILLLFDGGSVDPLGAAIALASGLAYAAYILLLAHFRHREISGFRMSFYLALICSGCMLVFCLATCQLALPQTARGWLVAFAFSLALSVGAAVLFQQGTFLVGGQHAAILSTLEPITSILMGILLLHETLTPRILLGSALTLLASVLLAVFDGKGAPAPENSA
ncbi:MAG: DMT family transporter [Oscillospiraceae bacterium]|nr:DMT family transporter [Oscillospiraceae bacterium]